MYTYKNKYILSNTMITKVFQSGYSQAVRIPVDFRFDVDTVEILHGKMAILFCDLLNLKQIWNFWLCLKDLMKILLKR